MYKKGGEKMSEKTDTHESKEKDSSSDGFSLSVPGTCSGNIGEQVLFPHIPVPFPCSREDPPPSPGFLPLDRDPKEKLPPKKVRESILVCVRLCLCVCVIIHFKCVRLAM